jgi:AAA15 family ATPase/GTPase
MLIKKIKLKNFTVFGEMETDCCTGINLFIGENGTGKTHLLKLIYTFCEWGILYHDGPEADIAPHPMLDNMFQGENYFTLARISPDGFTAIEPITIAFETSEGEYIHHIELFDNQNTIYEYPRYFYEVNNNLMVSEGIVNDKPGTVFVPAKEMLSHSGIEKDYYDRNLPLDSTLIEVLDKAGVSTLRTLPTSMSRVVEQISDIIGGTVLYRNNKYFIEKSNGALIPFAIEAEGYKKFGLISRLVETGHIKSGSILVWDEPDANLNPKLIPELVNILLELSRQGVQIFLATHDYNLMKYFSMTKRVDDHVSFYSLYKTENGVACEREEDYDLLQHNAIIDANIKMLEDDIERVL